VTSEAAAPLVVLGSIMLLSPSSVGFFQDVVYPYIAAAAGAYMGVFLHSREVIGTTSRVNLFLFGLLTAMFTGPVVKDLFLSGQPASVAVFVNWAISASALALLPIIIRRVKKTAQTVGPDFIEKDGSE
jgi:hypothetical protein